MCKVITRDAAGNVNRSEYHSVAKSITHLRAIGVHQSGIRRSSRISMRSVSRSFSTGTRPFKLK